MTPDDKKIIDLDSARKKQKAEQQKERIKNIFGSGQKDGYKARKNDGGPADPSRLDMWRWFQFIAALAVTALLMRNCGFF